MRTVKKSGQSCPSFDEIQSKWRLFRFASTLLPALLDTQEPAAIVATRLNDHCVEVVSNTLQTEGAGFLLRLFTFFGLLSFFWQCSEYSVAGLQVCSYFHSVYLAWGLYGFFCHAFWRHVIDTVVRKYVLTAVAVASTTFHILRKARMQYGNLSGIGFRASAGPQVKRKRIFTLWAIPATCLSLNWSRYP